MYFASHTFEVCNSIVFNITELCNCYNFRIFSSLEKEILCPFTVTLQETIYLLSVSIDFIIPGVQMWSYLCSFVIIFLFHFAWGPFTLQHVSYSFNNTVIFQIWICHILFSHSSVDEYFHCLYFLVFMNKVRLWRFNLMLSLKSCVVLAFIVKSFIHAGLALCEVNVKLHSFECDI